MRPCLQTIALALIACIGWGLDPARAIAQAADAKWKVGVASTVITPDEYIWMGGYAGRKTPARAKVHDLWAKALVMTDAEGKQSVLVTLDLIGIDRELAGRLVKSIQEVVDLPRERIALSVSHTHSGPALARTLPVVNDAVLNEEERRKVERYTSELPEKIKEVVAEAVSSQQAVSLSYGCGHATFAVNRRENPERGVPAAREAGRLKGPVDYDVPVLAARGPDGELLAVVFGYACHATTTNGTQWCGDYPGFAHQLLDERHAGAMSFFCAGCGGDQNPLPRRGDRIGKQYGTTLADAVDEVLAGVMTPVGDRLHCSYEEIPLGLAQLPTQEELLADSHSPNKYVAARARLLVRQLEHADTLSATYPYPVQVWKFGHELSWVFLGGEVVVDYSLRIKREVDSQHVWVTAYANDVMAYIPSRRVLLEGGYEGETSMVNYGLPTIWSSEVEESIVEEVIRQTNNQNQDEND
ncbi:neutral/alkaline non-lysosomal ceramidase N-terminal domain-containing protein [Aeoliella sp.]|uniref:neutral/alkaline non-lysosomal ceramidase N-terminal domain-containing protein n=1 Tax=Aeoliella sp. TaxID=2795800 RepID=UPI003CCBC1AC